MSEACNQLIDYFNDQLEPIEKKAFEDHLKSCEACQEELNEWKLITEDLPYSVDPVEPNAGMKERILGNVLAAEEPTGVVVEEEHHVSEPVPMTKANPKKKSWVMPTMAAALLFSLIGNAVLLSSVTDEGEQNPGEVAFVDAATTFMATDLTPSQTFQGVASAAMVEQNEATTLLIQAENLEPLQGSEAYQVWLIDKDGNPVRAGTFIPNERGIGAVQEQVVLEGREYVTLAITLEPEPDNVAPEGVVVLSANF